MSLVCLHHSQNDINSCDHYTTTAVLATVKC